MWPAFNNDVLVDCMADLAARHYWSEWGQIRCPTLIVCGERGNLPADHAIDLAQALPRGESVSIANAGQDVHLDAPKQLADELRRFLS